MSIMIHIQIPTWILRSSTRGSILDFTMKIPAILLSIILHLSSRTREPAPSVVEPVRAGWLQAAEVAVEPRRGGHGGDAEAAQGEEGGDGDEHEGDNGEP